MRLHICNYSIQDAEAGESWVQGRPGLYLRILPYGEWGGRHCYNTIATGFLLGQIFVWYIFNKYNLVKIFSSVIGYGLILIIADSLAPTDQTPQTINTKCHTNGPRRVFASVWTSQIRPPSSVLLSTFLSSKLLQTSSLSSEHSTTLFSPKVKWHHNPPQNIWSGLSQQYYLTRHQSSYVLRFLLLW